jgi:hypothetical protein
MADKEMIAATLAAALIAGRGSSSTQHSVEQLAVATYQRVLAALNAATDPNRDQVGPAGSRR